MRWNRRLASGVESGVIMSVRTPAILVSSIFTGYSFRDAAESCLRHLSAAMRLLVSVRGPDFGVVSEASPF
jgi:hypothetical protein